MVYMGNDNNVRSVTMGDKKNTDNKEKQNPFKDLKPKEIPTVRRTYEYHGKKDKEKSQ